MTLNLNQRQERKHSNPLFQVLDVLVLGTRHRLKNRLINKVFLSRVVCLCMLKGKQRLHMGLYVKLVKCFSEKVQTGPLEGT